MQPRRFRVRFRLSVHRRCVDASVAFLISLSLLVWGTGGSAAYGASRPVTSEPGAAPIGRSQHLGPDRPACDDPENPCYTAPQMRRYFIQRTHHFYRLNRNFDFPQNFVHRATVAHHHWCQTHPVICQQNWDQLHLLYDQGGFRPCGADPGWFCLYQTNLGQCAGGVGAIYWSCVGAYHSRTVEQLHRRLNDTEDLHLSCLGDVLWGTVFGLPGGPAGMVWGGGGGALTCSFRTWLGE